MKITVEISEEVGRKIDLEAKKDGHSNRNAVIRKVLNLFFDEKPNFTKPQTVKQGKEEGPA